mmetsp:Transcript_112026/g.316651  ORF Transcript_112026/g.316651 Transcript_112026/m.316651 type:complete len:244 (-) Transcript_112026:787-1518(-)
MPEIILTKSWKRGRRPARLALMPQTMPRKSGSRFKPCALPAKIAMFRWCPATFANCSTSPRSRRRGSLTIWRLAPLGGVAPTRPHFFRVRPKTWKLRHRTWVTDAPPMSFRRRWAMFFRMRHIPDGWPNNRRRATQRLGICLSIPWQNRLPSTFRALTRLSAPPTSSLCCAAKATTASHRPIQPKTSLRTMLRGTRRRRMRRRVLGTEQFFGSSTPSCSTCPASWPSWWSWSPSTASDSCARF